MIKTRCTFDLSMQSSYPKVKNEIMLPPPFLIQITAPFYYKSSQYEPLAFLREWFAFWFWKKWWFFLNLRKIFLPWLVFDKRSCTIYWYLWHDKFKSTETLLQWMIHLTTHKSCILCWRNVTKFSLFQWKSTDYSW